MQVHLSRCSRLVSPQQFCMAPSSRRERMTSCQQDLKIVLFPIHPLLTSFAYKLFASVVNFLIARNILLSNTQSRFSPVSKICLRDLKGLVRVRRLTKLETHPVKSRRKSAGMGEVKHVLLVTARQIRAYHSPFIPFSS
ncbi:hypothetical protein RvY_14931 [Ramazzottius varieornatus]|uniref:Uncharacterized protein n=1 Tax=Ramazzottius varieornatus TaxID=947166 RepID=A0A1D1VUI3_RAMVA|nr:hypothetical protein RvY_14931 [Ramazzottius varieornatus]